MVLGIVVSVPLLVRALAKARFLEAVCVLSPLPMTMLFVGCWLAPPRWQPIEYNGMLQGALIICPTLMLFTTVYWWVRNSSIYGDSEECGRVPTLAMWTMTATSVGTGVYGLLFAILRALF